MAAMAVMVAIVAMPAVIIQTMAETAAQTVTLTMANIMTKRMAKIKAQNMTQNTAHTMMIAVAMKMIGLAGPIASLTTESPDSIQLECKR